MTVLIYVWCIGCVVVATGCGMLTRRYERRQLRIAAWADAGCEECYDALLFGSRPTQPCARHR